MTELYHKRSEKPKYSTKYEALRSVRWDYTIREEVRG